MNVSHLPTLTPNMAKVLDFLQSRTKPSTLQQIEDATAPFPAIESLTELHHGGAVAHPTRMVAIRGGKQQE